MGAAFFALVASESLRSPFGVTLSTIEGSVAGRFKGKLCYFTSAFRAFPVSFEHLSGKFSVGIRIIVSHIFLYIT